MERQKPDLRAVAVRNDDIVPAGDGSDGLGNRRQDVVTLDVRFGRFVATKKGVAAERHHDEHGPPLRMRSMNESTSVDSFGSPISRKS